MATRQSHAEWTGDLKNGHGTMALGSGAYEGAFSFRSRFENGDGTSPEELLAAAHAGCFSMALSNILAEAGSPPDSVKTNAKVHLEMGGQGPRITRIELDTEASVPGMSESDFLEHAQAAKENCPVSQLFKGTEIELDARLKSS